MCDYDKKQDPSNHLSNKTAVRAVLAPAPALSRQVASAAEHAKKVFCVMPNIGDGTRGICLVLLQDKLKLNEMVKVDCYEFLDDFSIMWKL